MITTIAPLTPAAAAYRADLSTRGSAFGPLDGNWVALASVLEHAAYLPVGAREELLQEAAGIAYEAVGAHEMTRFARDEWSDDKAQALDSILIVAEHAQQVGAFTLSATILHAFLSAGDDSLSVVRRGRALAQLARVASKLGHVDEAKLWYRRLDRLGMATGSAELRARSRIGLVALAQLRGNYPEMLRHARAAARLARQSGVRSLVRHAENGLTVIAGAQHRFNDGLVHAWRGYQACAGDSSAEAEILQTFGQLSLEAGHAELARAAFSIVVSRPLAAHIILPALGGLAIAGAKLGRSDAVRWAAAQVRRAEDLAVPRYSLASALLDCATALALEDHAADADAWRRKALRLGRAHGFHEIVYRADAMESLTITRLQPARPLSTPALRVAQEVASMEPTDLPENVEFIAEPR